MKDFDPESIVLDEEEQWIEDHLEEFVPAPEWVGKTLREAAHNTLEELRAKEKANKTSVTLRLSGGDLTDLKRLAEAQGMGYQTLISSVLHRYANGTLVDVGEAKKLVRAQLLAD